MTTKKFYISPDIFVVEMDEEPIMVEGSTVSVSSTPTYATEAEESKLINFADHDFDF